MEKDEKTIYIGDFCDVLLQLIEQEWQAYRVLNIGSGELLSVNQIVESIKTMCPNFQWIYKESNALDVRDFKLDLSLLSETIEYKPTSLRRGLKLTKEWYNSRCCNIINT